MILLLFVAWNIIVRIKLLWLVLLPANDRCCALSTKAGT